MPAGPVNCEPSRATNMPLARKTTGFVASKWGTLATSLKKAVKIATPAKKSSLESTSPEDMSLTSLISNLETIALDDRKPLVLREVHQAKTNPLPVIISETILTQEQQQTRLRESYQQSQQVTVSENKSRPEIPAATPITTIADATSFALSDFEQLRAIGSGSYGCVTLCRHISSGTPCIIKAVSKAYAFVKHEQQHALNEKQILNTLTLSDCPFAAHVYGYFQDEKNLYYVMEYIPGGELFTYMVEYDKFDDNGARFFVAQLALVLQHMHEKNIVYRDVKPENMLVDERGYIKVCDFGFSRIVKRGERAYTMCGTPEYIAPEILRGKGHGVSVDLWSLGIFAYELLVGRTPFEGCNSRATHVNILSAAVRFPDYVSENARDFIRSLLVTDETHRLGYGAQFDTIFEHPWFEGLDLDALKRRELPSPIHVRVNSKFDSRNFEACVLEDKSAMCAPLTPDLDLFFAAFDSVTREFPGPEESASSTLPASATLRPVAGVVCDVFA